MSHRAGTGDAPIPGLVTSSLWLRFCVILSRCDLTCRAGLRTKSGLQAETAEAEGDVKKLWTMSGDRMAHEPPNPLQTVRRRKQLLRQLGGQRLPSSKLRSSLSLRAGAFFSRAF